MEVAIRKMGNSQGVLIPKPILTQIGLDGTADLQVRNGVIEIRAIRAKAGPMTRFAWPSRAATRLSGPRSPTRATTSWSGDEDGRYLVGSDRPDRGQ